MEHNFNVDEVYYELDAEKREYMEFSYENFIAGIDTKEDFINALNSMQEGIKKHGNIRCWKQYINLMYCMNRKCNY